MWTEQARAAAAFHSRFFTDRGEALNELPLLLGPFPTFCFPSVISCSASASSGLKKDTLYAIGFLAEFNNAEGYTEYKSLCAFRDFQGFSYSCLGEGSKSHA